MPASRTLAPAIARDSRHRSAPLKAILPNR